MWCTRENTLRGWGQRAGTGIRSGGGWAAPAAHQAAAGTDLLPFCLAGGQGQGQRRSGRRAAGLCWPELPCAKAAGCCAPVQAVAVHRGGPPHHLPPLTRAAGPTQTPRSSCSAGTRRCPTAGSASGCKGRHGQGGGAQHAQRGWMLSARKDAVMAGAQRRAGCTAQQRRQLRSGAGSANAAQGHGRRRSARGPCSAPPDPGQVAGGEPAVPLGLEPEIVPHDPHLGRGAACRGGRSGAQYSDGRHPGPALCSGVPPCVPTHLPLHADPSRRMSLSGG